MLLLRLSWKLHLQLPLLQILLRLLRQLLPQLMSLKQNLHLHQKQQAILHHAVLFLVRVQRLPLQHVPFRPMVHLRQHALLARCHRVCHRVQVGARFHHLPADHAHCRHLEKSFHHLLVHHALLLL